jgi:hypothetical protein
VLDRNRTLPTSAMIKNKIYVDENRILNPYQQNQYAQNNENITVQRLPIPYGSNRISTDPLTVLKKGTNPDVYSPYIPASAIKDQNMRIYVNKEQTMVVNPFYDNNPQTREINQKGLNRYIK